jgi:hypothetical protein
MYFYMYIPKGMSIIKTDLGYLHGDVENNDDCLMMTRAVLHDGDLKLIPYQRSSQMYGYKYLTLTSVIFVHVE